MNNAGLHLIFEDSGDQYHDSTCSHKLQNMSFLDFLFKHTNVFGILETTHMAWTVKAAQSVCFVVYILTDYSEY